MTIEPRLSKHVIDEIAVHVKHKIDSYHGEQFKPLSKKLREKASQ